MRPRGKRARPRAGRPSRPLGAITKRWLAGLSLSAGLGFFPAAAPLAEPQGGNVVSGSAEIQAWQNYQPEDGQPGSQYGEGFSHFTNVETHSPRTHIQWQSFDIGATEGVYFDQPSPSAITWNSVTNSRDGTFLNGYLGSNGRVGVSDPNGLYIGGTAVFDVGEFIAAAGELVPPDFNPDELHFTNTSTLEVAEGAEIRALDSVTLIGRHVANHGRIVAEKGSIAMIAGDEVWIREHGSPIGIHMSGFREGGDDPDWGVDNGGTLEAHRGAVRLAAGDFLAMAVRNTGDIAARDISVEGGEEGGVALAGTLTASDDENRRGGTIEVTGDWIALQAAKLDASGAEGGGTVRVGGEAGGQGETPTARGVYADSHTTIHADALERGDGGEIVLWGDEIAKVHAELSARGGPDGGDGGFIETSSHGILVADPDIDVSAPQGQAGNWLIDPIDVTITGSVTEGVELEGQLIADAPPSTLFQPLSPDSQIAVDSIVDALEGGSNVTVTTQPFLAALGEQRGDLTVETDIVVDEILGDDDVGLQLLAAHDLTIQGNITNNSTEHGLDLKLHANDTFQPQQANFQEAGDLTVEGNIQTGGGDLEASGANVTFRGEIDTRLADLTSEEEGGTVRIGFREDEDQFVFVGAGDIRLEGDVTTQGGGFTAWGDSFTTAEGTPAGVAIHTTNAAADEDSQGWIEVLQSGAVAIGGDLTTGDLSLGAGTGGSGDLDLSGRTLTADTMAFSAGDGQNAESRILTDTDTRFQNLRDGGVPESFEFVQDAQLTDDQIPELAAFGDGTTTPTHLGGMDYRLGSNSRSVALSTVNKVEGADLTLVGESFTDDQGTLHEAIELGAEIHPRSVSIETSGALEVTSTLAGNLKPVGMDYGDDDPTSSGIAFHAGTDGEGDLTFGTGVTLRAERIALRAGSGTGEDDTASVDAVTNDPTFWNEDGTGSPAEFTIRQDAELADAAIPAVGQFGSGGVTGMAYTLRSDAADIRFAMDATASALDGSDLALITGGEIDLSGLNSDISVGTLELGGVGDFTVASDAFDKFTVNGDEITLSAGAGRDGDLSFETGVEVKADEIWLVAGNEELGTSGSILAGEPEDTGEGEDGEDSDPFELPLFLNTAGDGAPTTFVFQQTEAITQDQLPTADQFRATPGAAVAIQKYGIRSAGLDSSEIQIGRLQDLDALLAGVSRNLVFSSPTITIERSDVEGSGPPNLVLDGRHELRGDAITLATREPPDISWGEPPVVNAGGMDDDTISGFDEGEFDPDAIPEPGEGTSPVSFTIDQLGGFKRSDNFLPEADTTFAGGLAPADRDPVKYTLISRQGTKTDTEEYGIEVDPLRVAGTDLVLRLGGVPTNIGGDSGEDFQNVGTIDFGTSELSVHSLDARTARELEVDGARITAEESIQLWAGGAVEDTELETSIGAGDLTFGTSVTTLTAEDITLKAGFGDEDSVVDARSNAPQFTLTGDEETSFTLESTGRIRDFDDGSGKYSEAPLAIQFTDGVDPGSLQTADTFQLASTAGEIELHAPSDVGILDGQPDKPGLVILRAPTITIEEPGAELALEGVTLKGDDITLSAPADQVDASANPGSVKYESFSNFYTSPSSFTIRQLNQVSGGNLLPSPSQFAGDLEETTYTVQSDYQDPGGDPVINVDSDFADRVERSKLVLQASDGNHIAVQDTDLDLISLTLNPDTDEALLPTMEFRVGNASITTEAPQVYRNPVILTGGIARFEATGTTEVDDSGWPYFRAGITFEERIDGMQGVVDEALLIHARDRVTFHESIGATQALHTVQINLEQQEIDVSNPFQILPTPDVEFGASTDEGETFQVVADNILLNPNPDSPDALPGEPGHRRASVPQTATFFQRAGDLQFVAGAATPGQGGVFEMGQNEKLSVADGDLRIYTYGGADLPDPAPGQVPSDYGRAYLGDLSASGTGEAGKIEVRAGVIHMLRREGGDVLRANGRVWEDAGVDYVADDIDFDFIVEGGDASATLEKNQLGSGRRARFAIPKSVAAPDWMERFPVADNQYNDLQASEPGAVLDGVPDGTPRADLSQALSEVVPRQEFRPPPGWELVDPEPLLTVGIRSRPVSNAEYYRWRSGAAIYDDLATGLPPGGPEVTAVEARLVADEAALAATLYNQVFGSDGSRAADIRETLQKALDDYREESRARRVIGFELRRYLNNRPSTQFKAYHTLQNLDALFRHHRRSGLTAAEYRGIQRSWLEDIRPEGISLDELAELIHPSHYVRGSDVLDVFGE